MLGEEILEEPTPTLALLVAHVVDVLQVLLRVQQLVLDRVVVRLVVVNGFTADLTVRLVELLQAVEVDSLSSLVEVDEGVDVEPRNLA